MLVVTHSQRSLIRLPVRGQPSDRPTCLSKGLNRECMAFAGHWFMLSYSYFDERVSGILGMIRLFYGNKTKTEQDVMKLSAFLTEQHISLVCQVEIVRPKKKHPVAQKTQRILAKYNSHFKAFKSLSDHHWVCINGKKLNRFNNWEAILKILIIHHSFRGVPPIEA